MHTSRKHLQIHFVWLKSENFFEFSIQWICLTCKIFTLSCGFSQVRSTSFISLAFLSQAALNDRRSDLNSFRSATKNRGQFELIPDDRINRYCLYITQTKDTRDTTLDYFCLISLIEFRQVFSENIYWRYIAGHIVIIWWCKIRYSLNLIWMWMSIKNNYSVKVKAAVPPNCTCYNSPCFHHDQMYLKLHVKYSCEI